MKYSDEFKATMVRKLADPNGPSATRLATEVGVHQATLSRWLREAGRVNASRVVAFTSQARSAMSAKRPQDWTAEEKLAVVIEAAGISEEELGAFLRRKGLHEAHLDEWRQQVLSGLGNRAARSSKPTGEARRVKELERELRRKDKALAEAAALLVLQKKVRAIWGDEDDDTAKNNER
jgi:transposase-like protein